MKIAKYRLKQILKEELTAVLNEREITYGPTGKRMTLPDDPLDHPDYPLPDLRTAIEQLPPKVGKLINKAIQAVKDPNGEWTRRYGEEELRNEIDYRLRELDKTLNHLDRVMPKQAAGIRQGMQAEKALATDTEGLKEGTLDAIKNIFRKSEKPGVELPAELVQAIDAVMSAVDERGRYDRQHRENLKPVMRGVLEASAQLIVGLEDKKELSRFQRYLVDTEALFRGSPAAEDKMHGALGPDRHPADIELDGEARGKFNRLVGFYDSMVKNVPNLINVLPKPAIGRHGYRTPIYMPKMPKGDIQEDDIQPGDFERFKGRSGYEDEAVPGKTAAIAKKAGAHKKHVARGGHLASHPRAAEYAAQMDYLDRYEEGLTRSQLKKIIKEEIEAVLVAEGLNRGAMTALVTGFILHLAKRAGRGGELKAAMDPNNVHMLTKLFDELKNSKLGEHEWIVKAGFGRPAEKNPDMTVLQLAGNPEDLRQMFEAALKQSFRVGTFE